MGTDSLMGKIREVTKETHLGEILNKKNPMPELTAKGLVSQVGNGLFVLSGELVPLMDTIERLFSSIARDFNARPIYVPTLLSEENMNRSNYLASFSHQAIRLKNQETSLGLACPTICYHFFASMSEKTVNSPQIITALGRCSRGETGNLNDLSRLANFTMREIVVLDTKSKCQQLFKAIQTKTTEVLVDELGLQFSIQTASDPFFGKQDELKKKAQLLSESKLEVRAELPFSGETVGVCSLNLHQNVFYDRFDIRANGINEPESMCVGFGYERLLFAILSQKGTNFSTPYYQKLLGT